MKKALGLAVLMLFAVSTVAQAQTIVGSLHDFSAQGWGTTEICQPCHTPHNADGTVADAPLWNHEVSTATFTPYTNATMNATTGTPTGVSLLCLSCHDGTVALDAFGGATGTTTITGDALVGTDLSNDHPISFTYNTALSTADGGLHDPSAITTELGGTIDADLLFSGSMECASCHGVHNESGLPGLLLIENDASDLCLTCHAK